MRGTWLGPGAFRLVLAMAVVLEHLSRLEIGKPAVMIFFMLSGYWVFRMYDEKYVRLNEPLKVFYVSRFLRLWPSYATAILLSFIILWAAFGEYDEQKWLGLPMLGVATHGKDMLGISWSLDIELQFYVLLPAVWLALKHTRNPLVVFVTVGALSLAGWVLNLGTGIETVAAYAPLFVAGAVICSWEMRAGPRLAAASVAAFMLLGAAAYSAPEFRPFVLGGSGNAEHDKMFALCWAILLAPFVAWNVRQASGSLDRHAGNLSYSVYLIHYPLIVILREALGGDLSDAQKLAFLVLIVPVSVAFYLIFDLSFERMRRRLLRTMDSSGERQVVTSGGS